LYVTCAVAALDVVEALVSVIAALDALAVLVSAVLVSAVLVLTKSGPAAGYDLWKEAGASKAAPGSGMETLWLASSVDRTGVPTERDSS
jgi:hypothetical protein